MLHIFCLLFRNLGTIYNLLEKGDLGLRIAAGEVVALLYELGRDIDESFNGDQNGLYNLLKDLATDSSRHRGKREKKQQRSSFRDVLRAVEVSVMEGFLSFKNLFFGRKVDDR